MSDQQPSGDERDDSPLRGNPSRSDRVRIRLPTGEYEWVTPEAFNLISEREFLDSDELRQLRRQRNVAAIAAAVAVILLAGGYLAFSSRGSSRRVESQPSAGAGSSVLAAEPSAPPVGPESTAAAVEPKSPAVGAEEEIAETVRAWARAWSAQDVERYLDFYSASFRPPDGSSFAVWEGVRRARIGGPESITIAVSDIETTRTGEGTAVARFTQGYRAPGYRDWVLKTLELAFEADRWRIVAESSSLIEVETSATERVINP